MSSRTTRKPFVISYGLFHVLLLSIGLFFSQFYTWSSGLPQVSHIVIVLSILFYISRYHSVNISDSKYLLVFVIYSSLINLIWFFINGFDISYLISSIYWIFNYIFFVTCINIDKNHINRFFNLTLRVITLSYLIEIIIWILGLGRYEFNPRYNGLFNDPNQMAFWILSTCAIYIYLSINKLKTIFVYSMALFLILSTLSRSGMLGFSFLTLALIIKQPGSLKKKIFLFLFFLALFFSLIAVLIHYGFFDSIIFRFESGLEERDSQSESRGFNAIANFPEMLITGSGQGNYSRFISTGNEIHSTWLGIVFYYGVVGASLFFIFLFKIYNRLSIADKIIFFSPMLYGFFTYSARTIIFWFVISVFSLAIKYNANCNEN